ncbi:YozE family protein [Flavonifractor plautii]|uniref:YozE family protein n=1 Tax=Flavonifractor plautii TaxID=292800 RepID=UPI001FF420D7|nr:YozE family protein [Flavonifractor plautii]MCI7152124.1 sterile alpha motif-like domain-containing protein [Flavonifractor plautii]MDY3701071.1 YozE family protein [Flavonifractor plautii]UOX45987.1 sterile alpha motif-like domain-containing protein [Flavonifractor plautii]
MFGTKVPWTFKTWILRFQGVDLPIGDLADDVTKDPDFPEEDYFDELLAHIQEKSHNNADVVETFVLAWGYYLASRDDSRPEPKLTTE